MALGNWAGQENLFLQAALQRFRRTCGLQPRNPPEGESMDSLERRVNSITDEAKDMLLTNWKGKVRRCKGQSFFRGIPMQGSHVVRARYGT